MQTRRRLLRQMGLIGCSLAAQPLVTTMTFAQAPWENRLAVIILRGGMDGLGALPPIEDPGYAALRPTLSINPGAPLDFGFALHPSLEPLRPLWASGDLAFLPAVSTPYRDRRSHFDGQDILEAGTSGDVGPSARRAGWLSRLLAEVPGLSADTAFAVGRDKPLILTGPFAGRSWSPATRLDLSPQSRLLLELVYADDPAFHAASGAALELAQALGVSEDIGSFAEMSQMQMENRAAQRRADGAKEIARFAAARLREDTRIAAFSLDGWDTHRGQGSNLSQALKRLSDAILTLRDDLGPIWDKTAVLAMTEFGRTAAENGTGGTDHGTGGLMIAAGGAVRGGKLYGRWPGLDESDLYQRRDLAPTGDVRRYSAWAMADLFGFDRALLEGVAFPGLEMGTNPRLMGG